MDNIIIFKENKERNKLTEGKDCFLFNKINFTAYISKTKIIVYVDIELKLALEFLESLKKQLLSIYDKDIVNLIYVFKDYIIPKDFYYMYNGMYVSKWIKIKINGEMVEKEKKIQISNRWLFISANVYSKENQQYLYEIKAINPKTNKESIQLCDREIVTTGNSCIKFLMGKMGIAVNENYKKDYIDFFYNFMIANEKKIQTKLTMPTLGWNKDINKFAPYNNKVHVDYSKDKYGFLKALVDSFSPQGDIKEFKAKVKQHTKNLDSDFTFSSVLSSPLIKITGNRSFLVNIYGASKNQKSLSVRLGLAVFGNYESIEMSGNDTRNVVMSKIYLLQNIACYIDEIVQEGNKLPIIDGYGFSNEKEKGRLDKEAEIKNVKTWKCIGITTSESSTDKDSDMAGKKNRGLSINLDCRPENLNEQQLHNYAVSLYRFINNNYGLLGGDYIDYLVSFGKNNIIDIFEEIESYLFEKNNDTNLIDNVSSVALICTGNYLYRKMFFEIDNIQYSKDLGMYALSKLQTKEELDVNTAYLNSIYEYFGVNRANFITHKEKNIFIPKPLYGAIDNEKREVIFMNAPLKAYLQENNFDWNYLKEMAKQEFITIANKMILGVQGKRIIVNIDRLSKEEKQKESETIVIDKMKLEQKKKDQTKANRGEYVNEMIEQNEKKSIYSHTTMLECYNIEAKKLNNKEINLNTSDIMYGLYVYFENEKVVMPEFKNETVLNELKDTYGRFNVSIGMSYDSFLAKCLISA